MIPNDDLAEALERDDEWIRRRTGIITRRHASRDVLVEHMAEQAARAALEASGVPAAEMDVIIVSTVTWMQMTPGLAPLIGARVGASPSAAAYDVNAGCAGFSYAIAQADSMIRSGLARHALVVGAEKLVDFTDPTDRTISFILGDGAGAVVLGPSDTPGVGPTVWGSDGRKGDVIRTTHDWLAYKYADSIGDVPWPTAEQDGPTIFRWATSVAPDFAAQAIEAAGMTPADIDVFIPHQANLRIVETMAESLGLRQDAVIARDVIDTGNTSGASVPLAMERLLREGAAHAGQTALLFGFGAGLCYSSQVVELPAAVGGDGEYHADIQATRTEATRTEATDIEATRTEATRTEAVVLVSEPDASGIHNPKGGSEMNEMIGSDAATGNAHSEADRRGYYADGWWQDRVLWDFLVDGATAHPERVMLTDGANTLTYGSLREKGIRLAAGLAGLGVGRGDRVAVQTPNWAEFGTAMVALSRLGAVIVPIMPIFRGEEIGYILEHSGAEVLIGPATFHKFDYLDMYLGLRESAPALREIVIVRPGATVLPEGVREFDALYASGDLDDLDAGLGATATADDAALLVYTSGTTARPKGCLHSFNTMHAGATTVIQKLRITSDDVVFNPSPVAHSTGLLVGMVLPVLVGAGTHFQPEWDPEEGLRRIERYGCTITVTATTFLSTLMQAYDSERHDVSHVRFWACAGAPIPGPVVQQARALFPQMNLIAIYGRSENFASTMTGPDDPPERAVTSDGRATLGSQVRILDDAGNDLPVGGEGDVAFKGPSLMLGYYRDPAAMAETLTPDGFHLSGDLGFADEAGFVRITGRVKDIIIRGGLNISAREVEDLLAGHPDILDVAVVAMPDPRLGEKACAFVVPRGDATPTVESLGEYLRAHEVAVQKLPERVELVDALPRTAPGKVRKNVLRDMIADKLKAEGVISV